MKIAFKNSCQLLNPSLTMTLCVRGLTDCHILPLFACIIVVATAAASSFLLVQFSCPNDKNSRKERLYLNSYDRDFLQEAPVACASTTELIINTVPTVVLLLIHLTKHASMIASLSANTRTGSQKSCLDF
jgi:hypothetical protein